MESSGSGGLGGGYLIGKAIIAVIAITVTFLAVSGGFKTGGGSRTVRNKLDTGNSYMQACIEDEVGYFENIGKAERELKSFWNETGVQPYVYIKEYDSNLTSNRDKAEWAKEYYDSTFDREDVFLLVYYSEEDVSRTDGYVAYQCGEAAEAVMDDEAVDIFLEYMEKNMESGMNAGEGAVMAFDDTADSIMNSSSKSVAMKHFVKVIKKALKVFIVVALVLIAALAIIIVVSMKFNKDEEEEEEIQKILDTPIEPIKTEADELTEKYLKMGSTENKKEDKKEDNEQAVHSNPSV